MIELILGGARSGKSQFAEKTAIQTNKKKFYIATARILDEEMRLRIETHRKRRDNGWTCIEEPLSLANIVKKNDHPEHCLLIDCLTLWVNNLLHSPQEKHWEQEKKRLLETLPELHAHVIFVSNEVGNGIIPTGKINRKYIDAMGWLHQDIARLSQRVIWLVAGIPNIIKSHE